MWPSTRQWGATLVNNGVACGHQAPVIDVTDRLRREHVPIHCLLQLEAEPNEVLRENRGS